MVYQRFFKGNEEFIVYGECGMDANGAPLWMCREYYSDRTEYFTAEEISAYMRPVESREEKIRLDRVRRLSNP